MLFPKFEHRLAVPGGTIAESQAKSRAFDGGFINYISFRPIVN